MAKTANARATHCRYLRRNYENTLVWPRYWALCEMRWMMRMVMVRMKVVAMVALQGGAAVKSG